MTDPTKSVELVVAEIYVKWNSTLEKDLHNRMVYVLSQTESFTDEQIKDQITKWLEPSSEEANAYSEASISSFERVKSDDPTASIMQSPKLAAGFVHVDMLSMQVHYYATEAEPEEPEDIMKDFRNNN
jgi:hypothetical protein